MGHAAEPGLLCLGIDPGLARLGYALVRQSGSVVRAVAFGCVVTSPDMPFTQRLLHLYDSIEERAFRVDGERPDFMCVERLFFGQNRTTAEFVWQARGVVMLLAAQKGLEVLEPKPSQVKLAVCGAGNADKTQVQRMVQRLLALGEMPRPDDAADALAIALTGLAYYRHERITGGSL
ncbi:MAG: crossover junction endodeoxyribonuclease RuvC [Synergistaceae bacterium]|jgi:crossover junction endodeoxyribonuclease RuvC|nr:crossover junction endodeoxyribonuclease RuvC [Synergistaceae bacterium]